jgi:hypothetical protein
MAAESASGLGNGSAEGSNKGNSRMTLGVTHLIGSRVVMAGTGTLVSGTPSQCTITFPQVLTGSASNYIVNVNPIGATSAIAAGGLAVSGLSTSSFVVTGPATVTTQFYWTLIKIN